MVALAGLVPDFPALPAVQLQIFEELAEIGPGSAVSLVAVLLEAMPLLAFVVLFAA